MAVTVTHSTEGSWESALATFAKEPGKQPHRLIDPELKRSKDYIPLNKPAKALKNLSGGVETNNRPGVFQIEIVGLAKTMPMKSQQWYQNLAEMLLDFCKATGTPIKFPCPFNKQQRLSNADWMIVEGIIGHKDVPENDHTDPGDISRVIPIMLELIAPGVDDMLRGFGQDEADIRSIYFKNRKVFPKDEEVLYWLGECYNARMQGKDVDTVLLTLDGALKSEGK